MTPVRRLHVAALALALAGGVGVAGLRSLDAARPVSVDDAVAGFRAAQRTPGATPAPVSPTPSASAAGSAARGGGAKAPREATSAKPAAPGATAVPRAASAAPGQPAAPAEVGHPPEGVYVYATTGYETGSAGPMSARHDYPAQTTMTVRRSGCGSSWRWEPVEDRWDDITDCVSDGTSTIKTYDTFHRFFGVSERMTYACAGDSWFRPPSTKAGFRWAFDCVSDRARTHTTARIVGVERVPVGDATVDALHVRFDTTLTGATEGTNPTDYWLALDGPYLLRKTGRVDAKVHTGAGTLDYHEEYDVRLTSRTPRT